MANPVSKQERGREPLEKRPLDQPWRVHMCTQTRTHTYMQAKAVEEGMIRREYYLTEIERSLVFSIFYHFIQNVFCFIDFDL